MNRDGSGTFQEPLTRDVTNILVGAKDIVTNYNHWKSQAGAAPNPMLERSHEFAQNILQQYGSIEKDIGVNAKTLVTTS